PRSWSQASGSGNARRCKRRSIGPSVVPIPRRKEASLRFGRWLKPRISARSSRLNSASRKSGSAHRSSKVSLDEMTKLRLNITMSLDGYVAGPNQSVTNPLGEGGEQLHEWAFATRTFRAVHGMEGGATGPGDDVAAEYFQNVGATIMGRRMFGGGDGPWGEKPWNGWWGENPPFHTPVFVLTHHARDPLEMQGGTTFHFVTEGIHAALEQAKEAARGKDVTL